MNTDRLIREIEERYNPEHDLLLMVKDLMERVEKLESELAERPTWEELNERLAERESMLAQQDY